MPSLHRGSCSRLGLIYHQVDFYLFYFVYSYFKVDKFTIFTYAIKITVTKFCHANLRQLLTKILVATEILGKENLK